MSKLGMKDKSLPSLRGAERRSHPFLILLCFVTALFASAAYSSAFPSSNINVPKVLSADEAFILDVSKENQALNFKWQISSCCYLYQSHTKALLTLPDSKTQSLFEKNEFPSGTEIDDPYFGHQTIYRQLLSMQENISHILAKIDSGKLILMVQYQGCAESGFCYPPEKKWFEIQVADHQIESILPTNEPQSADSAASTTQPENKGLLGDLAKRGLAANLAAFYFFGILLAFTPCVLPMIPILFGVIVGSKHLNTRKAFWLSLSYVISMAITYAIAGVLAATLGKNLQAFFQKPAIIIIFAALFVYLGSVQLGIVRLTFPHHHRFKELLHRLHTKQESGTYIGAAIMGILATLISSPCISAPMIVALSYISTKGDLLLGASTLFMLGAGLGTILLIIGTLGGKYVPKSGPWLHTTNHLFAILMFGLSIWLLERVLSGPVILVLWGLLALFTAWCMKTFRMRTGFTGHLGMIFVLYAGILFWGAFLGESSAIKPLQFNPWKDSDKAELQFKTIDSLEQYNLLKDAAKKANRPVFLVFYAKWCMSCQHLEHDIFTRGQIQQGLRGWELIRADITDYNKANQQLMKHFDVIGPPAILFIRTDGSELSKFRMIGDVDDKELLKNIENAKNELG